MSICIKLVQTLMLSGQSVCISGSNSSKDIKTTSWLKGCGTGLYGCGYGRRCCMLGVYAFTKSFSEIRVMFESLLKKSRCIQSHTR